MVNHSEQITKSKQTLEQAILDASPLNLGTDGIPVKRSGISVVQIIFDRDLGKTQTSNFNISKRELLEMLQGFVINLTRELLQESESKPGGGD